MMMLLKDIAEGAKIFKRIRSDDKVLLQRRLNLVSWSHSLLLKLNSQKSYHKGLIKVGITWFSLSAVA